MKRDQKNMTKLLVGVIVALVAVLAVLVVVLVLTPSATITSHSAQAEVEAEQKALKEAEKEGYYDTDIIEVVDLSALIGLDLTFALAEIGHGAEIDAIQSLSRGDSKRLRCSLAKRALRSIPAWRSRISISTRRAWWFPRATVSISTIFPAPRCHSIAL